MRAPNRRWHTELLTWNLRGTTTRSDTGGSLYGGGSLTDDKLLTLRLTVPIFNSTGKGLQFMAAKEREFQAQLTADVRRREIIQKVQTTFLEAVSNSERVKILGSATSAQERVATGLRTKFQAGLEERIPARHLLRGINLVVTRVLADLHEKLAPFYSEIGRPSIDPELMIRMLIVGYCYGIRFERRLCEEVEMHLAYRWFCRLDLDDKVPDHSTFSVNRHGRFRDSDILRHVFEAAVRTCMNAGLVKGEGFAVDASVIEADASRYHGKPPDEIDWSLPERQTRAAADFLAGLDDEDPDANRKLPKVISPTDPCSAWTAKANKRVQFGYGLNYLIDIENAVIVDVEATPARTYDEVAATKIMIKRTKERLGLHPKRLAADTAYGTGKFLSWLIGAGIQPHIPVWDMSQRDDGTLSRADFTFDQEQNVYVCPAGNLLTTTGTVHDGRTILYRTSLRNCSSCPIKPKCCPNTPQRKIPRDLNENARDHARALMGTPEFDKSRDERKKVEMRFAHLKTHHRFERMRLRGISGARDECHLVATAQNLKTLAKHSWRPPPNLSAGALA